MKEYIKENETEILKRNAMIEKRNKTLSEKIEKIENKLSEVSEKINIDLPKILIERLAKDAEKLENEKFLLQNQLEQYEEPIESEFFQSIKEKLRNFENLTFKEKREVKNTLIKKITINQNFDEEAFIKSGFKDRAKFRFAKTYLDIEWRI